MLDVAASPCIQCRIDPQLKSRLRAIAVERGLTESAVLKRLVIGAIGVVPTSETKLLAIEPIGRALASMSGCGQAITRSFANAPPDANWRRRPTLRCWFGITCA